MSCSYKILQSDAKNINFRLMLFKKSFYLILSKRLHIWHLWLRFKFLHFCLCICSNMYLCFVLLCSYVLQFVINLSFRLRLIIWTLIWLSPIISVILALREKNITVKYAGAAAMDFVSTKMKKKYNVTDEHADLYEAA